MRLALLMMVEQSQQCGGVDDTAAAGPLRAGRDRFGDLAGLPIIGVPAIVSIRQGVVPLLLSDLPRR
jgi:hypothetical protein